MKRCCESCRFFEKGSLPGAGWCRHPERLEAQSDLVLVRSTQLACRKGWDDDYWEPITGGGRGGDQFNGPFNRGPVPPASQADIAAILAAEGRGDSADQDRVVGATPSPIPQLPKALLTRSIPAGEAETGSAGETASPPDARLSILRAREVKRARANNRMRPTFELLPSTPAPSPDVAFSPESSRTGTSDPSVDERQPVTTDDVEPRTAAASVDEPSTIAGDEVAPPPPPTLPDPIGPVLPSIDFDAAITSAVPTVAPHVPTLRLIHGFSRERPPITGAEREVEVTPEPTSEADIALPDHVDVVVDNIDAAVWTDDPFDRDDVPSVPRRGRKARPAAFSFRSRWSDARRRHGDADRPFTGNAGADGSTDVFGSSGVDPVAEPLSDWRTKYDDDILPPLNVIDGASAEGRDRASALPALPDEIGDESVDGWEYPASFGEEAATTGASEPPWIDNAIDVVVRDDVLGPIVYDPEIDDYVIAPNVPRMCRTCQSFRPFDDGERGWCSNGWAFDNRQMVGAWDVPCASTLGTWWLPHDGLWDDGIYDRHAAPAPRFDSLMAPRMVETRARPAARKRRR